MTVKRRTLAGVMGSAALASLVMAGLTTWEGKKNRPYRDIVGVVTACRGTTKGVELNRVYTDAECDAMDEASAIEHAEGVRRCTPAIEGPQLAATVLLTYNIGIAGYCRSTVARRFNAGDLLGGCDAVRLFNKVTVPAAEVANYRRRGETCSPSSTPGRWLCTVRGLRNRREFERAMCLRGLPAA